MAAMSSEWLKIVSMKMNCGELSSNTWQTDQLMAIAVDVLQKHKFRYLIWVPSILLHLNISSSLSAYSQHTDSQTTKDTY